ncbi:MAG: AAA family ATPase [Thermoplasmatota archaeon]
MSPERIPGLSPQNAQVLLDALVAEVGKAVVGKREVVDRVALAVLADGHVLIEDNPGVAKTTLVKALAEALGLAYNRIQFTPDLLPADITGSFIYNMQESRFALRKGPVFTNVLLADEINRAPPKTQSALLEAMQERQTTLEGETHALPAPFLVFATQNPIEIEGTYPLPEAQLDRFLLKVSVGYPNPKAEVEMLRRRETRRVDEVHVRAVLDAEKLASLRAACEAVRLDDDVKDYIVRLVGATRADPRLALGASPRGSLALYKLAKAHALMQGRAFVVPDDVKHVAVPALAHRMLVTSEARIRGARASEVVTQLLASVPTPPVVPQRNGRETAEGAGPRDLGARGRSGADDA